MGGAHERRLHLGILQHVAEPVGEVQAQRPGALARLLERELHLPAERRLGRSRRQGLVVGEPALVRVARLETGPGGDRDHDHDGIRREHDAEERDECPRDPAAAALVRHGDARVRSSLRPPKHGLVAHGRPVLPVRERHRERLAALAQRLPAGRSRRSDRRSPCPAWRPAAHGRVPAISWPTTDSVAPARPRGSARRCAARGSCSGS